MELVKYLSDNYFTKEQLLEITKIKESDFYGFQRDQLMPKASYQLEISVNSDSFFGRHSETQYIEYYAKGYTSWLGLIQSNKYQSDVYSIFSTRYLNTIEKLKSAGHVSANSKVNSGILAHIKEEWRYFLNGTYGLCTKSGLPEDIATKEIAILQINELLEQEALTKGELQKLTHAVNLLDKVSSLFAPHERLKSSRHRLIDKIRHRYRLEKP